MSKQNSEIQWFALVRKVFMNVKGLKLSLQRSKIQRTGRMEKAIPSKGDSISKSVGERN